MQYLITSISLLFCLTAFSQGPPPPPRAALAHPSNKPIIREVVESCHYEIYYEYYKDSVVEHYGNEHGWSSKKIKRAKAEFVYTPPHISSCYNAYASTSKAELERIKKYNLSLSKKELKNRKSEVNDLVIYNMINSLKWSCKRYED